VQNSLLFDVSEGSTGQGGGGRGGFVAFQRSQVQVVDADRVVVTKGRGSFEDVFQFADVARPRVVVQGLLCLSSDFQVRSTDLFGDSSQYRGDQFRDVLAAVPQCGHFQRQHVQPEEQVLAEALFPAFSRE